MKKKTSGNRGSSFCFQVAIKNPTFTRKAGKNNIKIMKKIFLVYFLAPSMTSFPL